MPKFFIILLVALSFTGVSGCGNSECRKVRDLEVPAYETLMESQKWLDYWKNQEIQERESEIEVCRDTLKLNKKTFQVEKTGEVCTKETGVNKGTTLKAVENAQSRYEDSFEKWKKIVKLYPDCFDPSKVILANS